MFRGKRWRDSLLACPGRYSQLASAGDCRRQISNRAHYHDADLCGQCIQVRYKFQLTGYHHRACHGNAFRCGAGLGLHRSGIQNIADNPGAVSSGLCIKGPRGFWGLASRVKVASLSCRDGYRAGHGECPSCPCARLCGPRAGLSCPCGYRDCRPADRAGL